MAFDPQQKLLFVALQDQAQVVGIDQGMRIARRYPVSGSQPAGLALDGVEGHLYVAVRSAVIQLDSQAGQRRRGWPRLPEWTACGSIEAAGHFMPARVIWYR